MRNLLILFIIPFLFLCKAENQSKEDSNSIFLNLGLMFQRNNRLTISGVAVKGIVKTAKVNINPLNADGSCNTSNVLVTGSTDASGNYSLEYNKTGGVICLTVSPDPNGNTTLFDEKMNSDVSVPVSSSFQLVTIIPESKIIGNSRKNMLVSPFSKLLARRLQALVKTAGSGTGINALYKKASKEVVIRFGLSSGLSNTSSKEILSPRSTTTSISDTNYPELDDIVIELDKPDSPLTTKFISILTGFSYLANKHKKGNTLTIDDIDAIIEAYAVDFEDGLFDGKGSDGKVITIGSGTNQVTFSSTPLTSILLPAIVSYAQEGGKFTVGRPVSDASALLVSSAQITSQIQFVDNTPIDSNSVGTGTNTGTTVAPSGLTYTGSPYSFTRTVPIATQTPTVTGTITSCTASPTLPAGLSLNSSTCAISGTPTVMSAAANYTITASNAGGSSSTTINVIVEGIWETVAYIKAPNSEANDLLGYSVSISADTIVVGAYGEDSNQTTITNGTTASADNSAADAGAVYVINRTGTTWAQEAYIKAPNANAGDQFGWSVSISGDTIAVGVRSEDSNQTTITNGTTASADNSAANAGAVYVFKRTGTTWAQEAYLKAPNANAGDQFGQLVSISSDTIAVGAIDEDSNQTTITNGTTASVDNSATSSGAVYVFKRTGTTWAQEAYLKAPNAETMDNFGISVSTSSDTIAVGATQEDSNQTTITNGTTASA
ncbi:MAG TPA: putative Ig domain-containing protein, partial [Leptospiraceae bacterium]|nr:putative Ig domain-containing protein [Leptospiraceae bacterium]